MKQTRILETANFKAKIIVDSIRQPKDVLDAAVAGAHILTIPYKIMAQLPFHPKSQETIQEFDKAWQEKTRGAVPDFLQEAPPPASGGEEK